MKRNKSLKKVGRARFFYCLFSALVGEVLAEDPGSYDRSNG